MVSINITTQEKCHDYIQEKISNALGFGTSFLSKRNKEKYDELVNELLNPIFEEVFAETSKKKIKTIFSGKKNLFKDTAILKLYKIDDKVVDNRGSETHKKQVVDKKNKSASIETKISIVFKGDIKITKSFSLLLSI